MIRYNVDKKELLMLNGEAALAILSIQGWAFSDSEDEIDFEINTVVPCRITRYSREDVDREFKNIIKSSFVGFTIEIVLYRNVSKFLFEIIENSGERVEVKIDIDGKKILTRKLKETYNEWKRKTNLMDNKGEISDKVKSIMLSGQIAGKLYYNFDDIVYVQACDEVLLRGWQVAMEGENKIEFKSASVNVKDAFMRRDVNELFGLNSKKNGFEYRLALKKDNCIIVKIQNVVVGQIKIWFPIDGIKGNIFNGKTSWTKENQKEYLKRYGKIGTEFKKRESEIFVQESMMNTRPYSGEKVRWDKKTKNCNLSILVAVNSEIYIQKLLNSFKNLTFEDLELVLVGKKKLLEKINCDRNVNKVICDSSEKEKLMLEAYYAAKKEYVLFMDQEDSFEECFISYIADMCSRGYEFVYSDYDLVYKGEGIVRVNRTENFRETENIPYIFTALVFRRKLIGNAKDLKQISDKLKNMKNGVHNVLVMFHYHEVENSWNESPTKAIAFYLTQYHITEENNKWWGDGFTEWKNVKRAYPMFREHDQPRIPTELGYYDLVEDKSIQYQQVNLAKQFGIYGFCYYYYWFEGKRLLRKPLDQFVQNTELDLPYCICWANETWSKRWDGLESEILMQQVHNEKTDIEFMYDIIPMLQDKRYIKVDGKPLLLVYRFELFPTPYQTINRWRDICRKEGVGEIHIAVVQAFDTVDHRIYGADSSVEFPPHKIHAIPNIRINDTLEEENVDFNGNVYSYKRVVENMSTIQRRDYNLFPGSMLKWDNTARRLTESNVFHEFSPELYRRWLIKNHHYTKLYNSENIMFINAWNEWAEGSYLEPDETYGDELLRITKEVVCMK